MDGAPLRPVLRQSQLILSMALEERSCGYQDLVSNNNAWLALMKDKGLWNIYSGPRIRQALQIGRQVVYDNPAITAAYEVWRRVDQS